MALLFSIILSFIQLDNADALPPKKLEVTAHCSFHLERKPFRLLGLALGGEAMESDMEFEPVVLTSTGQNSHSFDIDVPVRARFYLSLSHLGAVHDRGRVIGQRYNILIIRQPQVEGRETLGKVKGEDSAATQFTQLNSGDIVDTVVIQDSDSPVVYYPMDARSSEMTIYFSIHYGFMNKQSANFKVRFDIRSLRRRLFQRGFDKSSITN